MRILHPNRYLVYFILLNIPVINYHPMNLLPAPASTPINTSTSAIADLFTKPISRHRFNTLIGDATAITPSPSVASTVDITVAATVVASASTVVASAPTATTASDSAALPIVLDTGATSPFPSDFTLEVSQAPYGLIRSAFDSSVVSDSKFNSVIPPFQASSEFASTPVDPYTLITGEDAIDLSFSDPFDFDSDCPSFTKVSFDIRQFGTASLTFIYSKSTSELLHIFVEPTQIDWLHWVPLPRLILPESYYHIFGLDYLQAFTLFHLIPIWIYCLLHFAVNLE